MTIIVEGMDNTGKTTLIEAITNHLQQGEVPFFHRKPRGPGSRGQDLTEIHTMLESTGVRIYDRTPVISELVYGKVLRGEGSLGNQSWHFLQLLLRIEPLIIYCRPHDDAIFNFGDRPQMAGVIEQKQKLLERYDFMMNAIRNLGYGQLVFTYDWQTMDLEEMVRLVMLKVRKEYIRAKVITELDERME